MSCGTRLISLGSTMTGACLHALLHPSGLRRRTTDCRETGVSHLCEVHP